MYLFKLMLPITTIANITNIGLMVISFGNILLVFMYCYRYKPLIILLFLIESFIFTANTSGFCEMYYIYINTHTATSPLFNEDLLSLLCLFAYLACMVFPYIFMANVIITTKLYIKRNRYTSALLLWFCIDMIIMSLLFISDLKHFLFVNLSLLKYPKEVITLNNMSFMIVPFILLFILVVFILAFEVYRHFRLYNANKYQEDTIENINNNIMIMLHTYKNAFCAINAYSDKSNDSLFSSPDEQLKIIKEISNTYFLQIKDFINKYKTQSKNAPVFKLINIKTCLEMSIKNAAVPKKIRVSQNCPDKPIYTIGDEFRLSDAFVCIINNSIEALVDKNSDPTISITVGVEGHNIYINFLDNGVGIAKKNIQKVFNPLYSSKHNDKNFGLGLNYIKKTINSHNGTVFIKSEENKYTLIQLTLPLAKQ